MSRGVLGYLAVLTVLAVAQAGIGLAFAWYMKELVNSAVSGSESLLVNAAVVLLLLIALRVLFGFTTRFLKEYSKATLENAIKGAVLRSLLDSPSHCRERHHSAAWMNRITGDSAIISNNLIDIVPESLGMLVRIVGAMVLLVIMVPQLSIILIGAAFVMLLFAAIFRGVMSRMHKSVQGADDQLRGFLTERLDNLPIVYVFSREGQTAQRAQEHMDQHKGARMRRTNFSNVASTGFSAATNLTYVIGAIWCAWGIYQGTVDYGTFVAVLQLVGQIQNPLASITGYVPRFSAMTASADRCMEAAGEGLAPARPLDEALAFYRDELVSVCVDDVSFAYPDADGEKDNESVEHVSFEIRKGQTVVLTGPSGSGKTTILRLLLGMHEPDSGAIVLDTDYSLVCSDSSWRSLYAYVPQGNQLMSGTVRDAVTFGERDSEINEGRLAEALAVSCAADFVYDLPDGDRTMLGEHGKGLSEGQIQRLAIARAIYSQRPILLLDEATSSLDEATELRVLQNIADLRDRTVVAVSHRPAALRFADEVVDLGCKSPLVERVRAWMAAERKESHHEL